MKHKFQKNQLSFTALFLLLLFSILLSCGEEEMESPMVDECDNTNYTYTSDIKQIFDVNCATSGCHDGSNNLTDYSIYQGIFVDRFMIRNGINQGISTVLDGRADLREDEQEIILCWIRDGAPE